MRGCGLSQLSGIHSGRSCRLRPCGPTVEGGCQHRRTTQPLISTQLGCCDRPCWDWLISELNGTPCNGDLSDNQSELRVFLCGDRASTHCSTTLPRCGVQPREPGSSELQHEVYRRTPATFIHSALPISHHSPRRLLSASTVLSPSSDYPSSASSLVIGISSLPSPLHPHSPPSP